MYKDCTYVWFWKDFPSWDSICKCFESAASFWAFEGIQLSFLPNFLLEWQMHCNCTDKLRFPRKQTFLKLLSTKIVSSWLFLSTDVHISWNVDFHVHFKYEKCTTLLFFLLFINNKTSLGYKIEVKVILRLKNNMKMSPCFSLLVCVCSDSLYPPCTQSTHVVLT